MRFSFYTRKKSLSQTNWNGFYYVILLKNVRFPANKRSSIISSRFV